MNNIKSIIRIATLAILFSTATLCIFSEALDSSETWFEDIIFAKAIGAACILALVKLYSRWRNRDKWIAKCDEWCMKDC